jgi:hypothetical protein
MSLRVESGAEQPGSSKRPLTTVGICLQWRSCSSHRLVFTTEQQRHPLLLHLAGAPVPHSRMNRSSAGLPSGNSTSLGLQPGNRAHSDAAIQQQAHRKAKLGTKPSRKDMPSLVAFKGNLQSASLPIHNKGQTKHTPASPQPLPGGHPAQPTSALACA